jgi:cytochrome b involved in lipid metabolism
MKKYSTISLFIFGVITTGVIVAGFISYDKTDQQAIITSDITAKIKTQTNLTLNSAELTKHNSSQSCWLLISGKIYDVTSFLPNHPGEAKTILPTCGTDATVAYETKNKPNGGKPHSANANTMLADYYIGDLNQTITTSSANPTAPPIANPNPTLPAGRSGDDEFDD